VIPTFGASDAMLMAVWYARAGVSSGSKSIAVWQLRTNSRETLYTKSSGVR
jgi:hypothetical protein